MSQYTKGKWTVDPTYDWVRDKTGRVVANCTGHEDQKANAHLIAAAPDLYEACKLAMRGAIGWGDDIRTALIKAEGK